MLWVETKRPLREQQDWRCDGARRRTDSDGQGLPRYNSDGRLNLQRADWRLSLLGFGCHALGTGN